MLSSITTPRNKLNCLISCQEYCINFKLNSVLRNMSNFKEVTQLHSIGKHANCFVDSDNFVYYKLRTRSKEQVQKLKCINCNAVGVLDAFKLYFEVKHNHYADITEAEIRRFKHRMRVHAIEGKISFVAAYQLEMDNLNHLDKDMVEVLWPTQSSLCSNYYVIRKQKRSLFPVTAEDVIQQDVSKKGCVQGLVSDDKDMLANSYQENDLSLNSENEGLDDLDTSGSNNKTGQEMSSQNIGEFDFKNSNKIVHYFDSSAKIVVTTDNQISDLFSTDKKNAVALNVLTPTDKNPAVALNVSTPTYTKPALSSHFPTPTSIPNIVPQRPTNCADNRPISCLRTFDKPANCKKNITSTNKNPAVAFHVSTPTPTYTNPALTSNFPAAITNTVPQRPANSACFLKSAKKKFWQKAKQIGKVHGGTYNNTSYHNFNQVGLVKKKTEEIKLVPDEKYLNEEIMDGLEEKKEYEPENKFDAHFIVVVDDIMYPLPTKYLRSDVTKYLEECKYINKIEMLRSRNFSTDP